MKGQGNGGGGVSGLLNNPSLPMIVLLFCSSEGEVDLVESQVEDVNGELLQVVVEEVVCSSSRTGVETHVSLALYPHIPHHPIIIPLPSSLHRPS